ncbi:unnamed protein product [Amoebophrya sp. A25]|nr:unnamed protein product [Amoebophrya sp. A25]|eukprot:GSA25T00013847001.1
MARDVLRHTLRNWQTLTTQSIHGSRLRQIDEAGRRLSYQLRHEACDMRLLRILLPPLELLLQGGSLR